MSETVARQDALLRWLERSEDGTSTVIQDQDRTFENAREYQTKKVDRSERVDNRILAQEWYHELLEEYQRRTERRATMEQQLNRFRNEYEKAMTEAARLFDRPSTGMIHAEGYSHPQSLQQSQETLMFFQDHKIICVCESI